MCRLLLELWNRLECHCGHGWQQLLWLSAQPPWYALLFCSGGKLPTLFLPSLFGLWSPEKLCSMAGYITVTIIVSLRWFTMLNVLVQPGAVKLVLWRHGMHVIQVHPVTAEDQFHCTRLYIHYHQAQVVHHSVAYHTVSGFFWSALLLLLCLSIYTQASGNEQKIRPSQAVCI